MLELLLISILAAFSTILQSFFHLSLERNGLFNGSRIFEILLWQFTIDGDE